LKTKKRVQSKDRISSPFLQPKQNSPEQNKHGPDLSKHQASGQKHYHWQLLEPTKN